MNIQELGNSILQNIGKVIYGKEREIRLVLAAMLAGGHVLLDDIPGTGKTSMARALAVSVGGTAKRVQFTPDLLPGDITGINIFDRKRDDFVFRPGPVFADILIADEINRTTPRTQSALLEAMEEGQVTVDGKSYRIPQPFLVFATQNPTGASGTQLLPDSQMDRFTVRLSIGYPAPKDEREMVLGRQSGNPLEQVQQIVTREQLMQMQREAAEVYIKPEIVDYIVSLVGATRAHPMIARGASPRATLSVTAMAKAVAYIQGRDYVVPKDVQNVLVQTLSHRLLLAPEADAKAITAEQLLEGILAQTSAPRL